MTTFFSFMASPAGRWLRVAAGLVLVVVGALLGGAWWLLAAVGLVPLLAGAFDVCLLAPLFHRPLRVVNARQTVVR